MPPRSHEEAHERLRNDLCQFHTRDILDPFNLSVQDMFGAKTRARDCMCSSIKHPMAWLLRMSSATMPQFMPFSGPAAGKDKSGECRARARTWEFCIRSADFGSLRMADAFFASFDFEDVLSIQQVVMASFSKTKVGSPCC